MVRNLSKGLSLGCVSMVPLYRIKPQFCDSVDCSWFAGDFSGFGGMGVSGLSYLTSLGGVSLVVTFFLRRGGFLTRVNCSVLVVVASSLNSSLKVVVLLVLAAGFLLSLSSLEVTVLFSGGDVFVVVAFVVVLSVLFFGVCLRVVCGLSGFEGGLG